MKNNCALILGGYINGYSIIRELYEKGLRNIILFDYHASLASKSNKILFYRKIEKTSESLKKALTELKLNFDYIIIYPTDDLQIEHLHTIYHEIREFCFIPFNYDNIIESLNKFVQYQYCEANGIPYPKTLCIESIHDLKKNEEISYPILIRPIKRDDLNTLVFRSLFLDSLETYSKNKPRLIKFLESGQQFVVSEVIPGDDTNIYAYVAYRSQKGEILSEWAGKKLTQFPDRYGVFASASNEAPEIVCVQGRKLLETMNLKGICEPEFKYDLRDGKFKLTEINLRSMMWHRVGNLSGVNIQYAQYLDAIGQEVPTQMQDKRNVVHFVYMTHEIINLFSRCGYWKHFKYNVLSAPKKEFAVFDSNDIKPFIFNLLPSLKALFGRWLRVLKIKQ